MLSLTQLSGFGGGGVSPLGVSYLETQYQTSNQSSYTFSAVGIGAADPNRLVLVGYSAAAGGARTRSSATIGGNAVTAYVDIADGTTQCCMAGWFGLKVASWTTTDIVVSFSGLVSNCHLYIYTMPTTQTVADAAYDTDSVAGTSSPSVTIDSPEGGVIFAACTTGVTTPADGITFTEANIEDAEEMPEGNNRNAVARKFTGSLTIGQSMTAVLSGSPSNAVVAAVSIRG